MPKAGRQQAQERKRRRQRWQRDSIILAFGLGWGTLELALLGARPGALAFISGILLSPIVLRYDESRRGNNGDEEE